MPYLGKTPSQATRKRYYKTASGSETSISGTMTVGGTLTFTDGEFVDVSLNGVALVAGTDYNTNTANTIAGLSALSADDQVEIVVYDTFSVFSGDVSSNMSVGGNLSVTGTSTLTGNVSLPDNAELSFGADSDFKISHNGSKTKLEDTGTGNLEIRGTNIEFYSGDGGETLAKLTDDGAAELYHNNTKRIETSATGVDVTGTVTADGLTVAGNVSVDGGTIKLDGNFPTGTDNTALGDGALDDGSLSGGYNVAIGQAALGENEGGQENVAVGWNSLDANTSGNNSTSVGSQSLSANTTGGNNVAVGKNALRVNTTASDNTALGYSALSANTTGNALVAVGGNALDANTTGADNTALGYNALGANTTANSNTAVGVHALAANTTGTYNTAVGASAGAVISGDGNYNTLIGAIAGDAITTGDDNTAVGRGALSGTTTASQNTGIGSVALEANTTGAANTAVGYAALGGVTTGSDNSAFGVDAGKRITTGTVNSCFGKGAGEYITTGSKNTILGRYNGNQGGRDIRTASNHIVLSDGDGNPRLVLTDSGDLVVPRVYNANTSNSANVQVDSAGIFRRSTSSRRYKNTITDATHGLTELLTLRPITYKGNNDGDTVFGGLIAEEVHDAGLTEFVTYNDDNEPDALAYGNMVSLCIKAIQEQQATITALEARIATLENA